MKYQLLMMVLTLLKVLKGIWGITKVVDWILKEKSKVVDWFLGKLCTVESGQRDGVGGQVDFPPMPTFAC